MNESRLNLLDNLFAIYNSNEVDSTYYQLSKFFIENYLDIGNLNIYDVAEANYTSRSTVRRFCKHLGYDNFLDFKGQFSHFNDGKEKIENIYLKNNFQYFLLTEVVDINKKILDNISNQDFENIVNNILNSKEVYFVVSNRIKSAVTIFQQNMALYGKRITLIDNISNIDNHKLDKDSIIFVVSITGLMIKTNIKHIKNKDCRKILFTIDLNIDMEDEFDSIYYLIDEQYEGSYIFYYTYGINFVFDLIFEKYCKRVLATN